MYFVWAAEFCCYLKLLFQLLLLFLQCFDAVDWVQKILLRCKAFPLDDPD